VLLGSPLAAGVAAHEGVDAHVAGSCERGGEGGGGFGDLGGCWDETLALGGFM